ncbi:MAG: DUF5107 domain-containing protein [Nocardioides sp.]|jgi:tetratricopeptide (TPR) repeat protein
MPDSTKVRVTTLRIPAAELGAPDRLAHLQPIRALAAPGTELPYARFSDYGRDLTEREIPALELTNGQVTALVLPTLGGRVWSLFDHTLGRELLHRNSVLRFANFGLSDAWFAGGIEWNLGSTGHSPLSTRPLHAAVLELEGGDVLRLWEWERGHDLVLQIDLTLDGRRLLASTRILNPDQEEKPLYYWTNIAAPETSLSRVVAPARSAWMSAYDGGLAKVDLDEDTTRPAQSDHSADYFFDPAELEPDGVRFVAALEPDGSGFAQRSTSGLVGRKLFCWGRGAGGERWQEWLSGPGERYLEIQAGACPTQLDYGVIPAGGQRSWTESFGAVEVSSQGPYDDVVAAVSACLAEQESVADLEARHTAWLRAVADRAPDARVWGGSGWGHVESTLREQPPNPALPFDVVADDSAVALAALHGTDPEGAEPLPPVSDLWWQRLEGATGWWPLAALGFNLQCRDEVAAAKDAYERSRAIRPNLTAERGLAQLSQDPDQALIHYRRALDLAPDCRSLATEALDLLVHQARADDVLDWAEALPEGIRRHGSTRLRCAQAHAMRGDSASARAMLDDLIVPDLPEGSRELDRLWAQVCPGEPLPAHLDFRMVTEETDP